MDKLKEQLAPIIKYGFWIGTVLIMIASAVVWYMSTSTLAEETDSEVSRLNGKISQISRVQGGLAEVPNDKSHEVMEQMIASRQEEVYKSWQTLFERQKPYLTWPREVLEEDFVKKIEGWMPIEQYVDFPDPNNELSSFYRERYRDHILNEPEKLAKLAGAIWTATDKKRATGLESLEEDDPEDVRQEEPVVAWSTSSQDDLKREIFEWLGGTPTTLQIYYSQESQWILKQLMMIIKEVNGDATQPYQAKIREINEIHFGKHVDFSAGEYTGIQGSAGGSGGMSSMATSSFNSGASGGGGLSAIGSSSGGSSGPTVDPAEGRYVDKDMKHISASALRAALKSNKPSDASLAIAKRIPIMMNLKMDQRAIHELLAACGSADLMVEVTQVRILGSSRSSGATMTSTSSTVGGGGGLGALGGSGTSPTRSSSRSKSDAGDFPFDVNVELYGMVYLYNTPDPNKLPVEQVTKETQEEDLGQSPASEPAAPGPAASDAPLPQDNGELQPPVDTTEETAPGTESEAPVPGESAAPASNRSAARSRINNHCPTS